MRSNHMLLANRSRSPRASVAGVMSARFVSLCAATLCTASTLFAQNVGKVSGVIRDAETREPLIGCNVLLVGTTAGASTDIDGTFFILNIPPGEYDVHASMLGYRGVTQRGVVVNAGRTTVVDFSLSSTIIEQTEVVVEATRPDVQREKTSTSAVVRFDEVQAIAGIRDIGDVLGLAADVVDGHFRGGRANEEYYTLQGMGIVNPLDNSSAFLPIMSAVEEVEVITSGFGAQYGNAQSGVVNISMKEGRGDKWRTRIETRMRAPGRKHFGPSVFDPAANPYLALLLQESVWLQGDPEAQSGSPYYGSMGSGLINSYARDPAVQLAVARTLWQMQTRRDLYRNYGNDIDNSVEVAVGGPVDNRLRMFLALRSNVEWPVFPTEQPDVQRQVMGNVVVDVGSGAALRLSGGFTTENYHIFQSANSVSGYQTWLWDRIASINYQSRTNLQLGTRFSHTLSPSTFYDVKLSGLWTRRKLGSTPSPAGVPDSAVLAPNAINWSFILSGTSNSSPDKVNYLVGDDTFRDELTRTLSVDAAITSQVTKSHLLSAGIQGNAYLLDVSNFLNVRRGIGPVEKYRATPFEGAVHLQDKMEFEGLIANIGVRGDVWSSGQDYFTNLFTPYLLQDTLGVYNPDAAPRQKSPVHGRVQPRVGISFPVSVNTVFHLNYGSFMQRPPFQYVVATRVQQGRLEPVVLGNPRLIPETTNSYDVGVMQGLGEGFTLDVSGYYKDVKNLLQQATYVTTEGTSYSTYFNRDYADIRGFRVAVTKRRGAIVGSVNYQYSVATGKSATAQNATPVFNLNTTTGTVSSDLKNVPVRDILLDFDRTHNLVLNVAYVTEREWGPSILGVQPFSEMTLSAISSARSGRPYTSPSNPKLVNGARTPGEFNTNMKLTKRLRNFLGVDAIVSIEVLNVFDNKTFNYDYIFATPSLSTPNALISAYENYAVDDPRKGIRYWWDTEKQGPFAVDQSFLIYSNMPRSFYFSLVLEL